MFHKENIEENLKNRYKYDIIKMFRWTTQVAETSARLRDIYLIPI